MKAKRLLAAILAVGTIAFSIPPAAFAAEGNAVVAENGDVVSDPGDSEEQDMPEIQEENGEVVSSLEKETENAETKNPNEAFPAAMGEIGENETEKPAAPKRPAASSIDKTEIIAASAGATSGILYSIDAGKTWQPDGHFVDLTPGTEYTIVAYYPEIQDELGQVIRPASDVSEPLVVTTVPSDTYLVSSEEELLASLREISSLPATKPRVNVRFKNDITISDTLTLPRLRGKMAVYLDLYGFALTCTQPNAPVVEIDTRATLGSSYYLDSGISSEQIRGGKIVSSGSGCGIKVGAGAIVTLNGLTFNCDVAIENSGEIDVLEHVQGRVNNNGYIGTITGTTLAAKSMEEWEIYNEGTIDKISDCTFSGGLGDDAVWRGLFDESRVGFIHNLGYIGSIENTTLLTERPIVLFNGEMAEIESISGSHWSNSNMRRGALCLNYGRIGTIRSGTYRSWVSLFLNHGIIENISGGIYKTDLNSVGAGNSNISKEDYQYLLSVGDVYSCFGNWGIITGVSGGLYNGGSAFYGLGQWYGTGYNDNIMGNYSEEEGTWVWYKAFQAMSDDAVFRYADGYGLSRSAHQDKETDYYGYMVGKLYKVSYDMSEAACYPLLDVLPGPCAIVKGSVPQDRRTEAAPDYLYYCEGDSVFLGDAYGTHRSWFSYYRDYAFVRVIQGKYIDAGKLFQKTKKDPQTGKYEPIDQWYVDCRYQSMYDCAGFEASDPEILKNGDSFKMPAQDITLTPKWRYNQPGRSSFLNSYTADYDSKNNANTLMIAPDFEEVVHPADAFKSSRSQYGYNLGIICHNLDQFAAYNPGVSPVSGWSEYSGRKKPFHYEWSLDQKRWYLSGEEAPVDSQVEAFLTQETGKASTGETLYLYIKAVPNEGSYDAKTGVMEMKPYKAAELIPNVGKQNDVPTETQLSVTSDNTVVIKSDLGAAHSISNGEIEVQVALESESGTSIPFSFHDFDFSLSGWPSGRLNDLIVSYHDDILRCHDRDLTITGIPAGTRVKARWRQAESGYIMSEKHSTPFLKAQDGYYGWYFNQVSPWSDWSEDLIKQIVGAPHGAPVLISRSNDTIAVKTEAGMEYSVDNGITWQATGIFVGLDPNTTYRIYSRYSETETSHASAKSPALQVLTLAPEDILPAPSLKDISDSSIEINAIEGLEYSINGGKTWQTEGMFSGLKPGVEYAVIARNPKIPDVPSSALIVKTVFPAPVLSSRTDTALQVETQPDLEYSIDGGTTWQKDGTFTGLNPGTKYDIIACYPGDTKNFSLPLTVATKSVTGAPGSPPILVSKSDVQIIVQADPDMEYSIDQGKTWQKSGVFDSLDPGTEYKIVSRFQETQDAVSSGISPSLRVLTKKRPTAEVIPPKVTQVTATSITVEPVVGQEYALRIPGNKKITQGWVADGKFHTLKSGTSYEVLTRLEETDDFIASEIGTEVVEVKTKPQELTLPVDIGNHDAYIYGFKDGTVKPEKSMTRAEAAAVFARVFPQTVPSEETQAFKDVPKGAWYYDAVQQLAAAGYLCGYEDGTFRPNAEITRAEFIAIAVRFVPAKAAKDVSFSDIETSWGKDSIQNAASSGWVSGYPDGSFRPQSSIMRAEAVCVVNRLLNRQCVISKDMLSKLSLWPDCGNTNKWYFTNILEASISHHSISNPTGTTNWTT